MLKLPKIDFAKRIGELPKTFRLEVLRNEAGSVSKSVRLLCEAREGQGTAPRFLGENGDREFTGYDGSSFSPDVYLHQIEGAAVIGRTEFILRGDTLYYPHVIDPLHDVFMAELQGKAKMPSKGVLKLAAWPRSRRVGQALSMLGQCNGNYLHFLTEALTRLALADQIPELKDVPVLVEGNLHPKLFEALDLLNHTGREVIHVREYEQVHVDKLFYITPPCYTPPETRTWYLHRKLAEPRREQFVFSSEALKQLRLSCTAIAKHYVPRLSRQSVFPDNASNVQPPADDVGFVFYQGNDVLHASDTKRVFLERRAASVGNGRLVLNEETVRSCLKRLQFASVHIADLRFAEQVLILSRAEIVVSAVGASIGNLIFAEPGVRTVLLSPTYPGATYFYFANLLAALGHDLTYVLGRQRSHGGRTKYNRDFWVPVNLVLKAVEES